MKPNGYHILVVDDDLGILAMTSLALERGGYRTTPVLGGEAAAEALKGRCYDAILTDLNMPGMDGEAVLKNAREIQPQAPVIIMTGNPHQLDAGCSAPNGPDGILAKPFTIRDLLKILDGLLCRYALYQAVT